MEKTIQEKLIRYRVAPNIALIKYWGKYDEELILPLNNNISVTLDVADIFTETSIEESEELNEDVIILNGKYESEPFFYPLLIFKKSIT